MIGYEVGLRGGPMSAPQERAPAEAELLKRVSGHGPWQVGMRGEELERVVGPRHLATKVHRLVGDMRAGDRLDVTTNAGKGRTWTLKAVAYLLGPAPPIPDPAATPAIQRAWVFVHRETERLELELGRPLTFVSQGIYNCRHIDGSSTWSQHAWHNGLDGHVGRSDGALDDEATSKLAARVAQEPWAAQVLWHVAGHFGHMHISGDPMHAGVPPCA